MFLSLNINKIEKNISKFSFPNKNVIAFYVDIGFFETKKDLWCWKNY